jgi:hypothetical protein
MTLFFGGRQYRTPITVSRVDDSALANVGVRVGDALAIIGSAVAGKPKAELRFQSPADARAMLIGGDLLTAIEKAFSPSPEVSAPGVIIGVRVNPATQAALMLVDGNEEDAILLTANDWGARTNGIKIKVEEGTSSGKRLTTQLGEALFTQDNVGRAAFTVEYTGGEVSAAITVTDDEVSLLAPNDTVVATIDLTVHDTVAKLVDAINAVTDFVATVGDSGTAPTLNGLDSVDGGDVTDALTVRADLQAAIDWFNSTGEGFVSAVRPAGAGAPPADIPFTFLAGGSDGTITNQDWIDAFNVMQGVDVQWFTPLSADTAIHAMAEAHAQFMSDVSQRERRTVVGGALGQTIAGADAAAKALDNDRVYLAYQGYHEFDPVGKLELRPPYMTAALIAAAGAGAGPGAGLTNKALSIRGLEFSPRNPADTDVLISAGVLAIEDTPNGFRVVKSVSTWRKDQNFNRIEMATGTAIDMVSRSVRESLDILRGERGSPTLLTRAMAIADTTLRELSTPEPSGPGVLVGDVENPPFRNLMASIVGDRLRVTFQASPVIPVNYVTITIFAVPFQASASA